MAGSCGEGLAEHLDISSIDVGDYVSRVGGVVLGIVDRTVGSVEMVGPYGSVKRFFDRPEIGSELIGATDVIDEQSTISITQECPLRLEGISCSEIDLAEPFVNEPLEGPKHRRVVSRIRDRLHVRRAVRASELIGRHQSVPWVSYETEPEVTSKVLARNLLIVNRSPVPNISAIEVKRDARPRGLRHVKKDRSSLAEARTKDVRTPASQINTLSPELRDQSVIGPTGHRMLRGEN